MNKLIVGAGTLVAIVVALVVFTTLDSSAQENDGSDDATTTTTIPGGERPEVERFGFGFGGELPAELDELLSCLADQGIAIPEDPGLGFFFDLSSDDFKGLVEALEACGFPDRFFSGGFLDNLPFSDELPEGFPFEGLPEDFLDELPEGFPFDGLPEDFLEDLPEGFPFGEGFRWKGLPEDFLDELPEGFPFGEGFEFRGPSELDRDALALCLSELGNFNSVDAVRNKLDECLPEEQLLSGGHHHFRFDFDEFFDLEREEPELENSSA